MSKGSSPSSSVVVPPYLRSRPDGLVTFLVRPNQRPFIIRRYQSFRDELQKQSANGELHAYSMEYLSAFPDWISRIGPSILRVPQMVEQARLTPSFALEFLKMDYGRFADEFEPVVLSSGEHVRELLTFSARHRLRLGQPEKAYRQSLAEDCYHGMVYARDTSNASLSVEIEQWAVANRDKRASAAWHYLVSNPNEPCYHYARVLRSSPFYYWLCCVQMPERMKASEEDALTVVGGSAKWAAHFACSNIHPVAMERVLVKNYAWFAQYMIDSGRVWNTGQWHRMIYEPVVRANMEYERQHGETLWFVGLEIAKITLRLYRMFDVDASVPSPEGKPGA